MIFFNRKEYNSEKNGKITVEKFLFDTRIVVNGCFEAGQYLIDMWVNAFKRIPKNFKAKNILILGLGGGNIIRLLQKKYPHANINVVEWDEVMIDLAKKLKLFSMTPLIRISNRDAFELLKTMTEKFDIVIVDLFTGPTPPPFLGDDSFLFNLKKVLNKDGLLFLNIYQHVNFISFFQKQFYTEGVWKFRANTLALFKQLESESFEKTLPSSFIDMRQSETFLRGSFKNGDLILQKGAIGMRNVFKYFAFEYYTGDNEPKLNPFKGFRLVIWDRVTSDYIPKGWRQMIPGFRLSTVVISDLISDEYWKSWSETARRYRTKWGTQTDYEINDLDLETFTSYYMKFGLPKETRRLSMEALERRIKLNKDSIRIISLTNKVDKKIVAGMVFIDDKNISQSYYLTAFMDKDTAPAQAGLWLINYWFVKLKENGIRFANFGPIWTRGQPKSWKGFTEFKSHFRPITLKYKRPLFKFILNISSQ
ncbi:TPA: hypothetical protein DEP94_01300 [Candidatus Nomurabacteria bacterium]|nr:hypothetical protein [Candidatus Nomurabacteria bacterium]